MEDFWACYLDPSGEVGPNYWQYFAECIAELVAVPEGAAILDLGTYDGNVLFKGMRKAGIRGRGIGIDIYPGGFHEGFNNTFTQGLSNVGFAQMDATYLGFPSETFDVVLGNFVGWDDLYDFVNMEFLSPDLRMAEILRVLKSGGQVGIGFWIEQSDIEWLIHAFKEKLPPCKALSCYPLTSYSRESLQGNQIILRTAGFHDVKIHVVTTTFVSPDLDTWWKQMKQVVGDYFKEIPELEGLKDYILIEVSQYQTSKGICFDKTVGFAFGVKP